MRALGRESFMASDERHPQYGLGGHLAHQGDGLQRADLTDRDMWVDECRVRRRDDDVSIGDPVQSAARTDTVDGRDHGLADVAVPARQLQVKRAHGLLELQHGFSVEFRHVGTHLERPTVSGVHDDAHVGVASILPRPLGIPRASRRHTH